MIPFTRSNVDTDLIIPARFMKTVTREGLGDGCFAALRGDAANPFDDPRYSGAPILVAGANFGCGSSREHAVWALQQIGIRAVVAPSFGEIFERNALRNGLIAIRVAEPECARLADLPPPGESVIDVAEERILLPDGAEIAFALDPFRKHLLVNGLDEVDATLEMEPQIAAYERRATEERPWIDIAISAEESFR